MFLFYQLFIVKFDDICSFEFIFHRKEEKVILIWLALAFFSTKAHKYYFWKYFSFMKIKDQIIGSLILRPSFTLSFLYNNKGLRKVYNAIMLEITLNFTGQRRKVNSLDTGVGICFLYAMLPANLPISYCLCYI